jgi:hypothetical protein
LWTAEQVSQNSQQICESQLSVPGTEESTANAFRGGGLFVQLYGAGFDAMHKVQARIKA